MSAISDVATRFDSLPLEIKIATQQQHTALNRLITSRLPLCLPPHTQTPELYATGFGLLSSIYTAFEGEWAHLLEVKDPLDERTRRILETLRVPRLLRSKRRDNDTSNLSQWTALARGVTHPWGIDITTAIRRKPYLLLAYTWIMYMALFNGGRWMRGTLIKAGPEFWQYRGLPEVLSFWHFDDESDGEEIKQEFKERFGQAAVMLTTQERADVVKEAEKIFDMCQQMVVWLDDNATNINQLGLNTTRRSTFTSIVSGPRAVLETTLGILERCFPKLALAEKEKKVETDQ